MTLIQEQEGRSVPDRQRAGPSGLWVQSGAEWRGLTATLYLRKCLAYSVHRGGLVKSQNQL